MNRHLKMISCLHEMTQVTSNHLKSGQIVSVLATLLFMSLDFPAFAKTLFAGNFVELHGNVRQRDVSVNYPARSKDGICGVEIKSSVIVLNSQVWARLAAALSVAEIQDDVAERPVSPVILNLYSPQLFYRFSDDGRDYSTIRFSSLSDEPLQTVFDRELGGGQSGVKVIAVAQPCVIDP